MKLAYLTAPEKIEIFETNIPLFTAEEILVKIAYCGICTLEQRLFTGERKLYYPIVPGHEVSGVIEKVGEKVITNHKVGDKVALDLVNRCRICPPCLTGNSNLCENRFKEGQRVLGGFSQYIVVNPEQCYQLPPNFSLKIAAFAEPVACCLRSLKKLDVKLGDDVLIIGAGVMGQLQAKLARAMGARVFVTDINEERLELAKNGGADEGLNAKNTKKLIETIKKLTNERGVNAISVTTPAKVALEVAINTIANNGKINIYTSYSDNPTFSINPNTFHRKEITITGSEGRSEADFYQSVRALILSRITVDELISKVYPLDEVEKAVRRALDKDTYRVLLKMEDEK